MLLWKVRFNLILNVRIGMIDTLLRARIAGYSTIGGTFRYGHIFWTSSGNDVNFVIEAAYKRSVNTSYFKGSAADGLAQVVVRALSKMQSWDPD